LRRVSPDKTPGPLDGELADAAFICDLARVRDLLARGADVNARNDEGRPPLVSAVLGGSLPLLDLLLAHGADVDARDQHDWTPLHFAAQEVLPDLLRARASRDHRCAAQARRQGRRAESGGRDAARVGRAHRRADLQRELAAVAVEEMKPPRRQVAKSGSRVSGSGF
jgi:hypothetical protein